MPQLALAAPGAPPEGPQGDRRAARVREGAVRREIRGGATFSTFGDLLKNHGKLIFRLLNSV